jgi:hypothetical protein
MEDWDAVSRVVAMGSCFGFITGAVTAAKPASIKWIEENRTTRFTGQMHAQRELNYAVLKVAGTKGSSLGWRIGLLGGLFK